MLTGAEMKIAELAECQVSSIAAASAGGDGYAGVSSKARRNVGLMEGLQRGRGALHAGPGRKRSAGIAVLVTPRPQYAFAMVGRLLYPDAASPAAMTGETGISAGRSCPSDGEA